MNALFQDLWHDLRAKRLWPVAVAMLIGIVAVPAVMTKSAAPQPPPIPVAPTPEQARESRLVLDGETAAASGKGSSLDVFAADDPFSPPKAVTDQAQGASVATAGGAPAGGDEGSGSPGGGTPGGNDLGGAGPPSAPAPVAPRTTTEYEYVADITFWNGDRRRRMKGLRKLDMLPNESEPVLIFMGATSDGGDAVFLVDSTLTTTGEGSCQPSRADCAFVQLGPGSEQLFTAETGESYRLRIDEIRRVKVKAGAAARPSARTADGNRTASVKRFTLPSLVDLVAVTEGSETGAPSNPEGDR